MTKTEKKPAVKPAPKKAEPKKVAVKKPVAQKTPSTVVKAPTVVKPVEKTVKIDLNDEVIEKASLSTKDFLAPKVRFAQSQKTNVKSGAFAGYPQVEDRIFLSNPKTYGEIPDLLELQKKGYADFLEIYLPKLFEDINPIWDIGGNKLNVTIS